MRALRRTARWALPLALFLLSAPPTQAKDWVAARSPHFMVLCDDGEKRARRVASEFEQFRSLFQAVLGVPRVDPGVPIIVFAVKNEDGMKELLPWYWERKGGARPAGVFFNRPDKIFIALRTDASGFAQHSVIYHEYVHLLTSLNFRGLPLWLNEGIAEFYATADIDEKTARFGQILPNHIRRLRSTTLLPLRELLEIDRFSPYYQEQTRATIFYSQSAAFTHFLILGGRGVEAGALVRFLQLLSEGMAATVAAEAAFGDLDKLERSFRDYISQPRFVGAKRPATLKAEDIELVPVSEAAAAAARGDFLALVGRTAEARVLVEEAFRLDPNLALGHEARGQVLRNEREWAEAEKSFQLAARLEPSNFLAPYYAARASSRLPDAVDRQESGLRRAIALNPQFAPAHVELAALFEQGNRNLDEAFRLALRGVKLRPDLTRYRVTLLRVLRRLDQTEQVATLEADLRRLARTDPNTLDATVHYFEETERPGEAEALLREAFTRNPGSPRIVLHLSALLQEQSHLDEAAAVLRTGLKYQPDFRLLLNNLAYLNADRNVEVEEALELIERALETGPPDPDYLDTKGWVLHRLGRQKEAEGVLREALAKRESSVLLDHLGDVLAAQGAMEEAIAQWKQAQGRSDTSSELRESLASKIESAHATAAQGTAQGVSQ